MADKKNKKRNSNWIINDAMIEETFTKLFVSKKRKPTWQEVAKALKKNEKTIRRHFEEIGFDERMKEYRMGTSKVMSKLFVDATTGKDVHHKRLWFEIVEGLGKKKEIDFTSGGAPITGTKATIKLSSGTEIEI